MRTHTNEKASTPHGQAALETPANYSRATPPAEANCNKVAKWRLFDMAQDHVECLLNHFCASLYYLGDAQARN